MMQERRYNSAHEELKAHIYMPKCAIMTMFSSQKLTFFAFQNSQYQDRKRLDAWKRGCPTLSGLQFMHITPVDPWLSC